jgi:very-short-patch-repair endonuclease
MAKFQRTHQATQRARELRQADNPAEAAMWSMLKAKKLGSHKFVRQLPIGPYFADFAQRQAKLVIEVDGSQHVGNSYDRVRDEFMRKRGYSVMRVWSHDVLRNGAAVCDTILAVLDGTIKVDIVAPDLRLVLAAPLLRRVATRPPPQAGEVQENS